LPILTTDFERSIFLAITAKCQELKCPLIAIGGMPDHVHLLVRLHPAVSVADLVKGVKGSSSHLVTHQLAPGEFFKWQGAYGAFTLSKDAVPKARAYIERQKEHHAAQELWQEWETSTSDTPEDGG
jgi:REP element-mobilizing transposase RayT